MHCALLDAFIGLSGSIVEDFKMYFQGVTLPLEKGRDSSL